MSWACLRFSAICWLQCRTDLLCLRHLSAAPSSTYFAQESPMLSLLKAIADLLHVCMCGCVCVRVLSIKCIPGRGHSPSYYHFQSVSSGHSSALLAFYLFLASILLLSHSVTVESECCLRCFWNDTFINKHYSNAYINRLHINLFPAFLSVLDREI